MLVNEHGQRLSRALYLRDTIYSSKFTRSQTNNIHVVTQCYRNKCFRITFMESEMYAEDYQRLWIEEWWNWLDIVT
jgi:hypothetical protein